MRTKTVTVQWTQGLGMYEAASIIASQNDVYRVEVYKKGKFNCAWEYNGTSQVFSEVYKSIQLKSI